MTMRELAPRPVAKVAASWPVPGLTTGARKQQNHCRSGPGQLLPPVMSPPKSRSVLKQQWMPVFAYIGWMFSGDTKPLRARLYLTLRSYKYAL